MKFDFYELNLIDSKKLQLIKTNLPIDIQKKLNVYENQVIKLYKEKQKGRLGIKSLGNEIRYDKSLENLFDQSEQNVLIKLTGNKISFFDVFINAVFNKKNANIYFLFLDGSFGLKSRLVDKTFIRKVEIENELDKILKIFSFKNPSTKLYFIEIKEFDNYTFILDKESGYTKLIKIQ